MSSTRVFEVLVTLSPWVGNTRWCVVSGVGSAQSPWSHGGGRFQSLDGTSTKIVHALASVGDKDIVFRLEGVTKMSHLL
jgi:hypothetical protein